MYFNYFFFGLISLHLSDFILVQVYSNTKATAATGNTHRNLIYMFSNAITHHKRPAFYLLSHCTCKQKVLFSKDFNKSKSFHFRFHNLRVIFNIWSSRSYRTIISYYISKYPIDYKACIYIYPHVNDFKYAPVYSHPLCLIAPANQNQ